VQGTIHHDMLPKVTAIAASTGHRRNSVGPQAGTASDVYVYRIDPTTSTFCAHARLWQRHSSGLPLAPHVMRTMERNLRQL
jgi:hypothetical protein